MCSRLIRHAVASLKAALPLLRERLESLAEETGDPQAINEDLVWDVANQITSDLGLRARSEVMTPMRHALTGRKVSCSQGKFPLILAERPKCTDYNGHPRCGTQPFAVRSRPQICRGSDPEAVMMHACLPKAGYSCVAGRKDVLAAPTTVLCEARPRWSTRSRRPPVHSNGYALGSPLRFPFFRLGLVLLLLLLRQRHLASFL